MKNNKYASITGEEIPVKKETGKEFIYLSCADFIAFNPSFNGRDWGMHRNAPCNVYDLNGKRIEEYGAEMGFLPRYFIEK